MELGLYTFGEFTTAPAADDPVPVHARLKGIVDSAVLADEAGLDFFGVGEHFRRDMTVSQPEVVLAHIAARTNRIRLGSAATVLSTQDPVRVFQQFATLDQLSDGRAEIIAGRGAFVESYPLFGYRLDDYEALFDEKIQLLLELREQPKITWPGGRFRSALEAADISPQPYQRPLPVWIAVGGTPASFARAGVLGAPLYMGFFGDPRQFVRHVALYRRAAEQAGHDPATLRTGSGGHMFIRRRSQDAREELYPYYSAYWKANGGQFAGGFPRGLYDNWVDGGLMVGSPQEVIDKIMLHHEVLGSDRYIGQYDVGNLPAAMSTETIELLATEVAPVIRRETAAEPAPEPDEVVA